MGFFSRQVFLMLVLLIAGFGLRVHQLEAADLNIDEAWSYFHSYYIAHPDGYTLTQILAPEPNNALHLLLVSFNLQSLSGAFGARWLSVIAGVLTVALTARLGYRLYGRRGAWVAGVVITFAAAGVEVSQIARPYALANLFAVASVLFWIEQRPRLNMFASILLVLSHVAALPAILLQDVLTAWAILRGARVNRVDWIIRRVPVYVLFLMLVYMQIIRRDIHVISSGTEPPSLSTIFYHLLNSLYDGFPGWSDGAVLMLFGVLIPVGIIALTRREWLSGLRVPFLWLLISYMMLAAAAILSDGAIRFHHLTYVAIPLALLIAGVLATASPLVRTSILVAYVAASVFGLADYFQFPYRYLTETRATIDELRANTEPVYVGQTTVLWELLVNNPDATYIRQLPPDNQREPVYLYVENALWKPDAPAECTTNPLWTDNNLQILICNR